MRWDTILFDLDGTLTDSGPGIINSLLYTVEKMGLAPHEHSFYRKFIGPPLSWSFQNLLGLSPEDAQRGIQVYREYYTVKGIWENEPYPGVKELLQELKAAGKTLMVATSKPEVMARQVLEHFALMPCIDYLAGATLDESRDRKAEAIARCLAQGRGSAVMVGDRKHDILGAAANRIPCVGVLYGYGSREEFEEAGAAYIAESVADLRRLLLNL